MTRTKDRLYFWGGILSNWAIVPNGIKLIDGENRRIITFPTSEHVFMWFKALHFSDDVAMKEIEKAMKPKEAKAIGRQVKGFDEEVWRSCREDYMLRALECKAESWDYFREYVKTETRDFVEASPYDRVWGIGMDEVIAAREDNPENWRGLNLLGKTLGRLRDELLASEL